MILDMMIAKSCELPSPPNFPLLGLVSSNNWFEKGRPLRGYSCSDLQFWNQAAKVATGMPTRGA